MGSEVGVGLAKLLVCALCKREIARAILCESESKSSEEAQSAPKTQAHYLGLLGIF